MRIATTAVLASLLVPSCLMLLGCGTGQDRTAATASSATALTGDVSAAGEELTQVVQSLTTLRLSTAGTDLKRLYGELKDHGGSLTAALDRIDSASGSTVANGRSQVDAWHQQVATFQDAGLRDASARREGDLRTAVDALASSSAQLKTRGANYTSQLNQTLAALDLDLSHGGVEAVKPTVGNLIDSAPALSDALNDVAAKSRRVSDLLAH